MKFLILTLLLTFALAASAQKQLILLKGEEVVLRLYPGDEISFKLKGGDRKWVTYINNLADTAVVTHRDTIPYHRIERLYFRQSSFANRLGAGLVAGGAGLFLIDQFNHVVVQGNSPNLDGGVSRTSVFAVAVGLPMVLIRKKSQKLDHKHKLMMAEEGSIFYRPRPEGMVLDMSEN